MAKRPSTALRVVTDADTDFTDLIEDEAVAFNAQFALDADPRDDADFEEVLGELRLNIGKAVDFMESSILPEWERAEEFYDGETDIAEVKDRSKATKTVVRDAIRSIKPNVMRVFTQVPEIVMYEPANALDFGAAVVAQAQTAYVNQLFWASGGYLMLLNATQNTLLKKVGIMKAHFVEQAQDEFILLTSVAPEQLEALQQMPDVIVVSAEPMDESGETGLLRVEVAHRTVGGDVKLEEVLLNEFFVDEAATSPEDAKVLGQRRSVTVGYARSLGLDYDDWLELGDYDAETDAAASESTTRRGYAKQGGNETSVDESQHRFLLTEVYARFDLAGTGIPQLYRFWLGGTGYEYIDHERVEENPYGVVCADPMPGAFFGRSIYDVLEEEQNTQTSLLRATCDNAHLANNRRLAFHDTLVNIHDVMNPALGAPIRFRQAGMIQEIGTESTLGTMLPLLQYLEQGAQNKVGVTNAAMGLDPDALQSTDKDAVRNTIQLAQGQVELICRNIAETGLRSVFTKLLRLSLRHKPRQQIIFSNGVPVPVDQAIFRPEMRMRVTIGTGTGDVESRIAALQMIIPRQEQIMQEYGLNNPICSVQHYMNAIVDVGALMGIPNMGRYFNQMTPEIAQQLDQMKQRMQAAQQPEKQSDILRAAEEVRGQAKIADRQLAIEWEREKLDNEIVRQTSQQLMDDDFRRDKMAQDLAIAQMQYLQREIDASNLEDEKERQRAYDMQKELLRLSTQLKISRNRAVTGGGPPKNN